MVGQRVENLQLDKDGREDRSEDEETCDGHRRQSGLVALESRHGDLTKRTTFDRLGLLGRLGFGPIGTHPFERGIAGDHCQGFVLPSRGARCALRLSHAARRLAELVMHPRSCPIEIVIPASKYEGHQIVTFDPRMGAGVTPR